MDISVIICTYNRCEDLSLALTSLAASNIPAAVEWEVLVVDNNSKDRTKEVVDSFVLRSPGRFRYIFEPRQGKSHALNSGIRAATGEVIAFTDDDVVVEPDWLSNLTQNIRNGNCAGAGGRTLPPRTFTPPEWLPQGGRYTLAPLALFDRGSDSCVLTDSPFGNNAAFRKSLFAKHGGFREDLGPQPNAGVPQKSEDSEFGTRVLLAGEKLIYEGSAILYHAVPKTRLDKKYFLDWWYDKARADVQAFGSSETRLWGLPLTSLRRLPVWSLRWLFATNSPRRFDCKLKVWSLAGTIVETTRMQRAKSKGKRQADVC